MKELLKTLCALDGVSSWEDTVRDYLYAEAKPNADSLRVDALGSLIVSKRGKSPRATRSCCAPTWMRWASWCAASPTRAI